MIIRFFLLTIILSYVSWFVTNKVLKKSLPFTKIMFVILLLMFVITGLLYGLSSLVDQ